MAKRKPIEAKAAPSKAKPVPAMYEDHDNGIQMPSVMITTEEKFGQIWGSRIKGDRLKAAWDKARKWRSKFD